MAKQNILIILIITEVILWIASSIELEAQEKGLAQNNLAGPATHGELVLLEKNSLLPISSPSNPEPKAVQKIKMIVTAYSSSPHETDSDPYITAAGTQVRDGVVANNLFPFGTKIRIPEIYGNKVFVVEDRMHWRKGYYHLDIWFPSYWEAKDFGVKRTYVEILES